MFLQILIKEAMFTSAASNLPCSCGIGKFFRLDLEIDRSSATAQPLLLNTLAWDEEAHRVWSRNKRKLTPGMFVLSPPSPFSRGGMENWRCDKSDTVTGLKKAAFQGTKKVAKVFGI